MGLRHIKPGLTAVRNAGTGIFHPTLGVEAVGVIDDEPIWPVAGGADDDADGDGGEDDDEGEEGDGDDDSGDGDDDADGSKAKIAALTEEKDRHYKRRKKAEQERDALKAELDALKAKQGNGKKPAKKATKAAADDADDADDEDDSDLAAERAARQRDKEAADAELRKAKIENAFLASREKAAIDWVNPGQVMTLLLADDDYEVEFDDRGNIDRKALVAELKRFAKANPHLVKPKAKTEDGEGDAGTSGKSGTSGSSMNGQRKGKGQAPPTREQLAKKYPALNNR